MTSLMLVLIATELLISHFADSRSVKHFTNEWVVRTNGGRNIADQLADDFGYQNMGQVGDFENTYLMKKTKHPRRSKREASHLTSRLNVDPRVVWAEQQVALRRTKRDFLTSKMHRSEYATAQRFNDEMWPNQWYLHDTRTTMELPEMHLHVTKVWDMGYTGKGIVLSVIDDGIEWNHTDLIRNYDPKASWDANGNDTDPFPRYDPTESNRHGTRCAGEIAMVANNTKCGVGVAYNAKIGGIRLLDGVVTDVIEAAALAYNIDHIHIFSVSWGPTDDGETVDAPRILTAEAIEKGCNKGRNGKGIIYIWASGNGGSNGDNCNCDGYTSSIYTLSIGSASQRGRFPWYAERCASTMASTYSSGAYTDQKIYTTHLNNTCTNKHSGTSAAAPLAAGIVALVLEANPNMTWRDVQHLTIWTAEVTPLRHNKGWKRNSAGLMYNSKFGFGLMNAEIMVKNALNWTTVPPKNMCTGKTESMLPMRLSSGKSVEVYFSTDGCERSSNEINYLEHVQISVDIMYSSRGALDMYITSPSGTESVLLAQRIKDTSVDGFPDWRFMTVHFWGEDPDGLWKLVIRDKTNRKHHGSVRSATLILHGTAERPFHMGIGNREYPNEELVTSIIDPEPEYDGAELVYMQRKVLWKSIICKLRTLVAFSKGSQQRNATTTTGK